MPSEARPINWPITSPKSICTIFRQTKSNFANDKEITTTKASNECGNEIEM